MNSLEMYKDVSFFKVLFLDCLPELWIPHEFVEEHGEILPRRALLRRTNYSGKTWNVDIKQRDGSFCFINGWHEFVKDNQLVDLDLLTFTLVDKSSFQVAVYGIGGCVRRPPSSSYCPPCEGERGVGLKTETDEEELSANKSFTALLQKKRKYAMPIPKAFALETKISTKKTIKLQNEVGGRKWRVSIYVGDNRGLERYSMTTGWCAFLVQNKLSCGTLLKFEFDQKRNCLIVKKETGSATNVV